jgi:Zn finger protein HypA/HybF involved in hydrogenase expression
MYQNQFTQHTHENECPYCSNYHSKENTCVAICPHCSSIHRREKVEKGYCPKITQFGKDNLV